MRKVNCHFKSLDTNYQCRSVNQFSEFEPVPHTFIEKGINLLFITQCYHRSKNATFCSAFSLCLSCTAIKWPYALLMRHYSNAIWKRIVMRTLQSCRRIFETKNNLQVVIWYLKNEARFKYAHCNSVWHMFTNPIRKNYRNAWWIALSSPVVIKFV